MLNHMTSKTTSLTPETHYIAHSYIYLNIGLIKPYYIIVSQILKHSRQKLHGKLMSSPLIKAMETSLATNMASLLGR